MINVSQSNIRYWIDYFELPIKRVSNKRRKFLKDDIDRLKSIQMYQRSGYHLWAIKELLKK